MSTILSFFQRIISLVLSVLMIIPQMIFTKAASPDSYKPSKDIVCTKYVYDSDGDSINMYCIEPKELVGEKDVPVMLFLHGGAFYLTLTKSTLSSCEYYAKELKARVFVPDYRSSYDVPFPGPMLDCYRAALYLDEHSEELGIDMNRAVVYGNSAGGDLTAAVTQYCRDNGGPVFKGQLMIYPVTDNSFTQASISEFKDAKMWSAAKNEEMWEIYLRDGDCGMLKYAAPLQSDDFSNLPRAYVEPAEKDILRDEGIEYAKALENAGVEVELFVTEGTTHGFDMMRSSDKYVQQMMSHRVEVMKDMLGA